MPQHNRDSCTTVMTVALPADMRSAVLNAAHERRVSASSHRRLAIARFLKDTSPPVPSRRPNHHPTAPEEGR